MGNKIELYFRVKYLDIETLSEIKTQKFATELSSKILHINQIIHARALISSVDYV